MSSAIALILVALGVASRMLPHPHGAVAIGALAIYAGARLPRVWAVLVPLMALVLTDAVKVLGTPYASTLFSPVDLVRYGTFGAIALSSSRWGSGYSAKLRGLQAIGASTLFFITSNLAVWLFPYGPMGQPGVYPMTLAGLADCFVQALPFYGNSLAAELIGVGLLFSLDAVALAGARQPQTLGRGAPAAH